MEEKIELTEEVAEEKNDVELDEVLDDVALEAADDELDEDDEDEDDEVLEAKPKKAKKPDTPYGAAVKTLVFSIMALILPAYGMLVYFMGSYMWAIVACAAAVGVAIYAFITANKAKPIDDATTEMIKVSKVLSILGIVLSVLIALYVIAQIVIAFFAIGALVLTYVVAILMAIFAGGMM